MTDPDQTQTKRLERHPLSAVFPTMGNPRAELAESIKANGLREPIVLYDGRILDGWNRYRACLDADAPARFVAFGELEGHGGDPVQYVIDKNIHRRNLTASQRAVFLAQLLEWRQHGRTDQAREATGITLESAANTAGVSKSTMQHAKRVVESGNVTTLKDVAEGRKGVKRALDELKPKPSGDNLSPDAPPAEQAEQVVEGGNVTTFQDVAAPPAPKSQAELLEEVRRDDHFLFTVKLFIETHQPEQKLADALAALDANLPPEAKAAISALMDELQDEKDLVWSKDGKIDHLQERFDKLHEAHESLKAKHDDYHATLTKQGKELTELRSARGDLVRELEELKRTQTQTSPAPSAPATAPAAAEGASSAPPQTPAMPAFSQDFYSKPKHGGGSMYDNPNFAPM